MKSMLSISHSICCRGLVVAALGLATAASVADDSPFSANVTLATDYVFRGISQTDEKGAIQGGFDYNHETGFYAGIWASNVNFDSETSTEMDYYAGFANSFDNGIGYDVGIIYYDYEGDSEFDYIEWAASLSYQGFGLGVNYSDELGDDGPKYVHAHLAWSMELSHGFTVGANVGYSDTDENDFWEDGEDSYIDYGVTLGYSSYGMDFALALVGTDLDDVDAADDRVVFSISKAF